VPTKNIPAILHIVSGSYLTSEISLDLFNNINNDSGSVRSNYSFVIIVNYLRSSSGPSILVLGNGTAPLLHSLMLTIRKLVCSCKQSDAFLESSPSFRDFDKDICIDLPVSGAV
jgi:hypothetical protein